MEIKNERLNCTIKSDGTIVFHTCVYSFAGYSFNSYYGSMPCYDEDYDESEYDYEDYEGEWFYIVDKYSNEIEKSMEQEKELYNFILSEDLYEKMKEEPENTINKINKFFDLLPNKVVDKILDAIQEKAQEEYANNK
jgi:hypothetical protein